MERMYYIDLDVPQENDQLLREGRQWRHSRGRHDSGNTNPSGPVDEDASAAVDCADRLDSR